MDGIKLFEYCCIDHAVDPLPCQRYEDCIELRVFHKGIQIFTVGNRELVFKGGDVLVVPAGVEYSTGLHPQYKSTYHRLQILCSDETSLLGMNVEYSQRLCAYLSSLTAYRYHGNPLLMDLICAAFQHVTSNQLSAQQQGCGELICFLMSLENLLVKQAPAHTPDIDIAFQYINDHITEDFCLQDLANLSGCSLSYFKERFTSQTGVTPMYYINWRKIAYAKRMIAQDYSVTEVSSLLNFNTPAYFSTVFKNYTSRTPIRYKELVGIELRKQRHQAN